jgi:hypothetical protein
VRVRGRSVWVATEDLGGDLSQLTLCSDVDWLWSAVRQRLRATWPSIGRARAGAVAPRHGLIVDLLNARSRKRANPVRGDASADLNREQRNAVRAILTSAVVYLWGPPGTGKTTTLASAVTELVAGERTVLVVTPSNAAADVVAQRIAERLACHTRFDHGLVVRYGSGTGRLLRSLWGDRLVPAQIANRLRGESGYTCRTDPQRHADRAVAIERALATLTGKYGGAACPLLRETGRRVIRSLRLRASAPQSPTPLWVVPEAVTRNAAVVVTTAHQLAIASPVAARMYDTVIVDEAGQASLPLVLLAAAHAREAVVVAGDPRQLPPPVQAREPTVRQLLGEDVFTLSGAVLRTRSAATCMLVEQHRMAPRISALVSAVWYNGKLRPHTSVLTRSAHPLQRAHGPLLFVCTHASAPQVVRTAGNSRRNSVHVQTVREVVAHLDRAGLLPRSTSMLITSPFRAQTSGLARAVGRFTASTVHSAQGGEADVVVLDLTDARGASVSQFLSAALLGEDGSRLLNVAASRARYVLIVVGDFAHLKTHGGAVVREFLRQVEQTGNALELPTKAAGPELVRDRPSESGRSRGAR